MIIIRVFYPKFGVTNKRITINTQRPFIVLFRGPSLRFCCSAFRRHSGTCSGRQVSLDGHVILKCTRLGRAQEGGGGGEEGWVVGGLSLPSLH